MQIYYIVYEVWKKGKSFGKGSCEIEHLKKIDSIDDINAICDVIKNNNPKFVEHDLHIQVLNFQFLKEENNNDN